MALPDPSALKDETLSSIRSAQSLDELEGIRVQALGKKGSLSLAMKELGQLEPDARREAGQALNAIKTEVSEAIDQRKSDLARDALNQRLATEKVDVSLAPRFEAEGRIHPLSRTLEEITAIFAEMGFTVAEGPDIESDYYNFNGA